MTIAGICARKSTSQRDRDDDDKSVSRQVANARAFAAARGWHVDEDSIFVDDGTSGAETTKLARKRRMLDMIREGKAPFRVIVMQSNDRLSRRDGDEAVAELKSIARAGIEVWFYSDATQFQFGTFSTIRSHFSGPNLPRSIEGRSRQRRARRSSARRSSVTSPAARSSATRTTESTRTSSDV